MRFFFSNQWILFQHFEMTRKSGKVKLSLHPVSRRTKNVNTHLDRFLFTGVFPKSIIKNWLSHSFSQVRRIIYLHRKLFVSPQV